MAQAVGRVSIKVSDCLPYLKCFNVEDIVNIRGHFSKISSWYNRNKQQIMKEKESKNQREADGCSQDWVNFLVLLVRLGVKRVQVISIDTFCEWYPEKCPNCGCLCTHKCPPPPKVWSFKQDKTKKNWNRIAREYSHLALNKPFYTVPLIICIICVERKNAQFWQYASHSCLFSSAKSWEKAFPAVVGKKAATHILKFVDFMNCELM